MSDDTSTPTTDTTPAAPRRRRAAGRPAGPPAEVTAATTPAAAPPAPAESSPATDPAPRAARKTTKKAAEPAAKKAAKAPAKKAVKAPAKKAVKAPAKKAVENAAVSPAEPVVEASVERAAPALTAGTDAPSVETAPGRRTRGRKAAAPSIPSFSAVPVVVAAGVADAPAAGLLMFQAPSVEAAPARRARPAKKTAPAVVVEDTPEDEDDAEPAESTDDAATTDDESGDGAPRRRRRRGGRGRRRRPGGEYDGSDDDDADPEAERDAAAATETAGETTDTEGETGDVEDGGGSSRRRRRRRRGGADGEADGAENDPPNTVTRVREPRTRSSASEITSVKGSTRLEAKKQRRREGRETGRRRPSILTEAEFLARREAVDRVMVVRQRADRTQIAVLEDGVLVEHYVNRNSGASMIGNVYLGKVQNVLPSMEAAFVDVGRGRNAVLYAGEVNWDAAGLEGQPKRIEVALKPGDPILVQVSKDPLGHKGARLTAQISLPGRFLVYVPQGSMTGISRKLPDTERTRLKSILRQVVPEHAGVIVRTAAEGAREEELRRDVERLAEQWTEIEEKVARGSSNAPMLLHGEPDLAIKVVRDIFNEDFGRLVVEGDEAWSTIEAYVSGVAPDLADRIEKFVGPGDLFTTYRIDEQLAKALDRKVWLPSGGSLVIDRTEAMTVVDVNTGKFTGQGGNLEETVTRNNLEAAEEIVRQLRLRDIGGIIVIDFIDMVLENNRDLVLRRLLECLGRDRTKHQVAEVTSLGLVQMTRKRIGQGLLEVFSEPCESCQGRGFHVHSEPVAAKPGDEESEGPAGRTRRRKGGDSEDEPSGGKAKGKSRRTAKSAAVPDVEPRVVSPEASAAMEKIHAAAAKAAAAVTETSQGASGEPGTPATADTAPPAKRTRGPRKATRKAGPAAAEGAE